MYFCSYCGVGFGIVSQYNLHVGRCRAEKALDEMEEERLKRNKEFSSAIPVEMRELIRNWKVDPSSPSFSVADPFESVANPKFYHIIPGGLGSDGIVVIEREEGGVVVIKSVNRPDGDIFASLLLRKVAGSLPAQYWRTPPLRALYSKSPEFVSLTRKLKILENVRDGGSNAPFINRIAQKQFLLVIEFEVAVSAFSIGQASFSKFWTPTTLRGLGEMVGMDMILNNWDRLPVPKLWKNDGNLGNVLLLDQPKEKDLSNLIVIDQTVTAIWDPVRKAHYHDKVKNMMSSPDFQWLPSYLQMCCGLPEPPSSIVEDVTAGFIDLIHWIRTNPDKFKEFIQESRRETLEYVLDRSGAASDEGIVDAVTKQTAHSEEFLHSIVQIVLENESK
jgi:hypothetical protein